MKKLLIIMVCLLTASTAFAGMTIKISPSYGLLLSPDVSAIEDITGSDVTKGGIGFGAQGLLGEDKLKFGLEAGYLPMFDLKSDISETGTVGGGAIAYTMTSSWEMSTKAIPVIAIANYSLSDEGSIIPFLEGGLGLAIVSADIKQTLTITTVPTVPAIDAQSSTSSESDSKSGYCLMLGGGATMEVSEKINVDLFVKYYNIGVKIAVEQNGAEEATSLLNIGASISLRL